MPGRRPDAATAPLETRLAQESQGPVRFARSSNKVNAARIQGVSVFLGRREDMVVAGVTDAGFR